MVKRLARLAFTALVICFLWLGIGKAEESTINLTMKGVVEEFKAFSWATAVGGDVVYLVNEGKLFGGAGLDIAKTPHDWVKVRAGYLVSPKRFYYAGATLNGGKFISKLIGISNARVEEFVEKALLNVGLQYAVNPNDWEQDFGLLITVVKWSF